MIKEMQNSNLYKCKLCKTDFVPRRTGGSEKIYCSKKCKDKFHSFCKQYSKKLLENDYISVEQLINLDMKR